MADEKWSYEKWVYEATNAVRSYGPDEAESRLYSLVNDIFGTAHTEGYHEGFGAGKVHDCECICEGDDPRCG